MIIRIEVKADPEKMRISSSTGSFFREVASVLAIRDNKIIAVGETADEMQRTSPEYWKEHKDAISFVYPFHIDRFDPLCAGEMLRYYTVMIHMHFRTSFFWFWQFCDRFDYDIRILEYDKITSEKRFQLEDDINGFLLTRKFFVGNW